MSYLMAAVLGIIQGVAEFLPISSSGHLTLFQHFFGMPEPDNLFNVLLHFATLIAVFIYYWSDIWEMITEFFLGLRALFVPRYRSQGEPPAARRLILLIIVATLPLFLVLPIKDYVEQIGNYPAAVSCILLLTGAVLFLSDRMAHGHKNARSATLKDALLIGVAQSVATLPGLSRSGSTIAAGMACGLDRKEKGQLPGDTVVATVMSNLGLHVFAREHGLKLECTSVGDRNVLERMQEKGYALGGEQSGHMIFLDYATTGDGQLTALQVLALLKESGKKASDVFGSCARYPQVLINVPVASNDVKKAVMASDALWTAVRGEEEQLAGSGRVLVRPSGTEALMRVMVEAKTEEAAQAAADRLAALIPGLAEG